MKQMKIFSVLAVAVALGLAACGGGKGQGGDNSSKNPSVNPSGQPASSGQGGSGAASKSSKHTHTAADDAQWQHDENRHWKDCKDGDGGKVDNKSHTFEEKADDPEAKAATCKETGLKVEVCSVCGYRKTTEIPLTDHTWEDLADGRVEPTCTEPGSYSRVCSVCGEREDAVVIPALDHNWVDSDGRVEPTCTEDGKQPQKCSRCDATQDVTLPATGHTWGEWEEVLAPTCTEKGSRKHKCSVCDVEETEDVAPTGHDIQLIGDETEPEAGKAKVRVYTCANECGTTYLGFKANEVSEESKTHLVIGDDGGARFWGRPIGNDVALNENGDPDESSHDAVFNDQQPGDFFEYVFDLTPEQVETLGEETLLYCEAVPAQWMRNNNMDFFACKPGDTDWTRGMYIDDIPETEENEKGTDIDDYRYILYVDNQPKAFDDSITNPVLSDDKAEFILPYVFNLHTGENRISLRMAGGYRSTFYNFTFRPYEKEEVPPEEEHTHTYANEAAGTLETEGCTTVQVFNCTEGDASALRWEAKNYDASSNEIEAAAADGSIRFNRAQGKNGEEDKGGHLVYKINSPVAVEKAGLDFYIQAHSQNVAIFDAVANDSGAGKDVDGEGKYTVAPTKRYALYVNDVRVELGEDPGASTAKDWFTWPVEFPLLKGENKIEIVALGGYRAKMYNFQLTGLPKISIPVKTWSWEEITAGKSDSGWASDKDFGEAGPAFKFNKENGSVTLNYESAAAQKVMLQLKIAVKQSNNALTGFWKQDGNEKTRISLNDTPLTAPETEPDFTGSVASSVNDSGIISVPEWYDIIELDLVAGANKIEVKFLSGGYSYYFGGAQLVK